MTSTATGTTIATTLCTGTHPSTRHRLRRQHASAAQPASALTHLPMVLVLVLVLVPVPVPVPVRVLAVERPATVATALQHRLQYRQVLLWLAPTLGLGQRLLVFHVTCWHQYPPHDSTRDTQTWFVYRGRGAAACGRRSICASPGAYVGLGADIHKTQWSTVPLRLSCHTHTHTHTRTLPQPQPHTTPTSAARRRGHTIPPHFAVVCATRDGMSHGSLERGRKHGNGRHRIAVGTTQVHAGFPHHPHACWAVTTALSSGSSGVAGRASSTVPQTTRAVAGCCPHAVATW